jgi:WD40 repeat protein
VAACDDKFARVWNITPPADAAAAPLLQIEHPSPVRSAAGSADNLQLATCGDDGVPRVFDMVTGKLIQRFSPLTIGPSSAAVRRRVCRSMRWPMCARLSRTRQRQMTWRCCLRARRPQP